MRLLVDSDTAVVLATNAAQPFFRIVNCNLAFAGAATCTHCPAGVVALPLCTTAAMIFCERISLRLLRTTTCILLRSSGIIIVSTVFFPYANRAVCFLARSRYRSRLRGIRCRLPNRRGPPWLTTWLEITCNKLFADTAHFDKGGKVPITHAIGMNAANLAFALASLGGME